MAKKTDQSGFGEKYTSRAKRVINSDGSFNVIKRGAEPQSIYQYLISISWGKFMLLVLLFYLVFNSLFACLYLLAGTENLHGVEATKGWRAFFHAFFFSAQTFTTVGYGAVSPSGIYTNIISTFEAMIGLMGFALTTGLLYGRFSQPRHSIRFSKNALIVDNEGSKELHFQIVNKKKHVLRDVEARLLLKMVHKRKEGFKREFYELKLRISKILFFPLNWRIVHVLSDDSPLSELTEKQYQEKDVELLVQIKAFDSTFNQVVHADYSYTYNEVVNNAVFVMAYSTDKNGDTVIDIDMIDHYEKREKKEGKA